VKTGPLGQFSPDHPRVPPLDHALVLY